MSQRESLWDARSLADAVLGAPTDSGGINVWLARDLARATLALLDGDPVEPLDDVVSQGILNAWAEEQK